MLSTKISIEFTNSAENSLHQFIRLEIHIALTNTIIDVRILAQGYCVAIISLPLSDSSPVVSKLSLLINYLLGKRLGYARGEDGKARGGETLSPFPSSPSLKSPF